MVKRKQQKKFTAPNISITPAAFTVPGTGMVTPTSSGPIISKDNGNTQPRQPTNVKQEQQASPISTSQPAAPLPGSANISIRKYIYYLPFPYPPDAPLPYTCNLPHHNPLDLSPHPAEPTSTLVLTSPGGTFVDVRILKPLREGDTDLPNQGICSRVEGLGWGENREQDQERLDWAFAGQSVSVESPENWKFERQGGHQEREAEETANEFEDDTDQVSGKSTPVQISKAEEEKQAHEAGIAETQRAIIDLGKPRHCQWHHWVDNRHPVGSPTIPIDKGLMFTIPNSDLALEHGNAEDPFSPGVWRTHEELWQDLPIRPCAPSSQCVCVVLRTEGESMELGRWRGVIVRLGQHIQGIIKLNDSTTVERWMYVEDQEVADDAAGEGASAQLRQKDVSARRDMVGAWKRVIRIGADFMPCLAAAREDDLVEGMMVDAAGCPWIVEELVRW